MNRAVRAGQITYLVLLVTWYVTTAVIVVMLFVHVHGPGDIAIGTNVDYCGLAAHGHSIEFYCQHGY